MFFGIVTPPMHDMSLHVDHNPCNAIHDSHMIYLQYMDCLEIGHVEPTPT